MEIKINGLYIVKNPKGNVKANINTEIILSDNKKIFLSFKLLELTDKDSSEKYLTISPNAEKYQNKFGKTEYKSHFTINNLFKTPIESKIIEQYQNMINPDKKDDVQD